MKKSKKNDTIVSTQEDQLLVQGDQLHGALSTHQDEIGMKFNKAGALKPEITGLREADTAYKASRALRLETLTPGLAQIGAEASRFIGQGKHILKDQFGSLWNLRWTQVGFDSGNLQVPRELGKRVALVERLGAWLSEHPEHENASLGVTAQAASSIHTRFTELRNRLCDQNVEERKLSSKRVACRQALSKRVRAVIAELGWVLADDDERWRAFGLTPPAVLKERRRQLRAAKAAAANSDIQVLESGQAPARQAAA